MANTLFDVHGFLTTTDPLWSFGTEVFRRNIAACVNNEATLSPPQQSALIHIVSECKQKGEMGVRDAMQLATWINTCRWR